MTIRRTLGITAQLEAHWESQLVLADRKVALLLRVLQLNGLNGVSALFM